MAESCLTASAEAIASRVPMSSHHRTPGQVTLAVSRLRATSDSPCDASWLKAPVSATVIGRSRYGSGSSSRNHAPFAPVELQIQVTSGGGTSHEEVNMPERSRRTPLDLFPSEHIRVGAHE